jgi:short-subunit dehydrogenase involved in D-alanine esterification of teichoic acids
MDLYVYYRVQDHHSAELQAMVMKMQEKLSNLHEINFSLKRRVEKNVDYQTWMEIYFSVSDEFADLLELAVNNAGLMRLTDGERHNEIFVDMPACV